MPGQRHEQLFVVTGGPGSGKSSLIAALTHRGLRSVPEAGRAIIRDQVRIGGRAVPWADRTAYAELMLAWEMRSYHEAMMMPGPVVMDRAIPDIVGYLAICGLPVPAHVEAAVRLHPYNRHVFLAPYWAEIFTQDAERRQDRQEAEATGKAMAQTYARLGYRIVELPLTTIEARAGFVIEQLHKG